LAALVFLGGLRGEGCHLNRHPTPFPFTSVQLWHRLRPVPARVNFAGPGQPHFTLVPIVWGGGAAGFISHGVRPRASPAPCLLALIAWPWGVGARYKLHGPRLPPCYRSPLFGILSTEILGRREGLTNLSQHPTYSPSPAITRLALNGLWVWAGGISPRPSAQTSFFSWPRRLLLGETFLPPPFESLPSRRR